MFSLLSYFVMGFGFMLFVFLLCFILGNFLNFLRDLIINTKKPIYVILFTCVLMGLVFMATRIPFKMPKLNSYLITLVHNKIVQNYFISFVVGFLGYELIYHIFFNKNKKRKPEYRRGTMDMPPVPPEELPIIKNKEIEYNPDDWELVWDYYGKDFNSPIGRISLSHYKIYHHKKYPNLVSYDDQFWWCYDRVTDQFFRVNTPKAPELPKVRVSKLFPELRMDLTTTFQECHPMKAPETKTVTEEGKNENTKKELLKLYKDVLNQELKDKEELIDILKRIQEE